MATKISHKVFNASRVGQCQIVHLPMMVSIYPPCLLGVKLSPAPSWCQTVLSVKLSGCLKVISRLSQKCLGVVSKLSFTCHKVVLNLCERSS